MQLNGHDETVQRLLIELQNSRARRKAAATELSKCAKELSKNGTCPPIAEAAEAASPSESGVHEIPDENMRIQVRRAQLIQARAVRKNGVTRLKRTCEEVRVFRRTVFLDPEKLKEKLETSTDAE